MAAGASENADLKYVMHKPYGAETDKDVTLSDWRHREAYHEVLRNAGSEARHDIPQATLRLLLRLELLDAPRAAPVVPERVHQHKEERDDDQDDILELRDLEDEHDDPEDGEGGHAPPKLQRRGPGGLVLWLHTHQLSGACRCCF